MGCGIGIPVTSLKNCYSTVYPIRIGIDDDFSDSELNVIEGRSRLFNKPANSKISLEFDAYYEDDIAGLRNILFNRFHEKKVFINDPVSNQVYDHFSHGANHWIKYGPSDTYPSSLTELSSGEYIYVNSINDDYAIFSNSSLLYTWVVFQYDISDFINESGLDAIKRISLFMHNPFYYMTYGGIVYPGGFRVFAYNITASQWTCIGEQSYTVSDFNLRSINRINQQYFTLKKCANFTNISDYIHPTTKTIQFAMGGLETRPTPATVAGLGFNYAALMINGYPVKQENEDNFTYRTPYDGGGSVATISLREV
jgi:hypothetical protein